MASSLAPSRWISHSYHHVTHQLLLFDGSCRRRGRVHEDAHGMRHGCRAAAHGLPGGDGDVGQDLGGLQA